jgi:pimeloyl-ACP methyl ester carboxylesterase
MSKFIHLALWALLIYGVYCAFMYVVQRHMIFPRSMMPAAPRVTPDIPGVEKLWVKTDTGEVEAWFLTPKKNVSNVPAPVLIFGHGNAELIDFLPGEFRKLREAGMGILLVEFPGYGRSPGAPSQAGIKSAFIAAYDAIVARQDVDAGRVAVFGRSLGGGAVCDLAAERPTAALILMSTFTSVRSMAIKYLAPGFMVRDPFENIEVVKAYQGPVLVIHCENDEIIPYSHGAKLSKAARNGRMLTYPGDHNNCPPSWNELMEEIVGFLTAAGVL